MEKCSVMTGRGWNKYPCKNPAKGNLQNGEPMSDFTDMQELVGWRYSAEEEAGRRAEKPKRRVSAMMTTLSAIRCVQIKNLVQRAVEEHNGLDWIGDPIDIETIEVLLDEQREKENQWLANNWDSIIEELRQKRDRELEHEEQEREDSVPLRR
jgi:hypothetical protein